MLDRTDALYHSPPPDSDDLTMADTADDQRDKKHNNPLRLRRPEAQLVALNDLYDENENPPLEQRAALAERLGMDSKEVNAWFANKRSASKKKVKGLVAAPSPPSYPPLLPYPLLPSSQPADADAHLDESDHHHSGMSTPLGSSEYSSAYPALDSDNRHVFDSEVSTESTRRMRMRPTPKQIEELRRLYTVNTHPSREDREALADQIGMKPASVTNWFQNQRSLARRRQEEEDQDAEWAAAVARVNAQREIESGEASPDHRASLPPASVHPSLGMIHGRSPPTRSHSDGVVVSPHEHHKVPPAVRRISSNAPNMRPRRTRPEPYQLEALKKLFARTPNPSIEERGALALEIDMEISKVTNWFRNLRQTARKKAMKANDEGEYGYDDFDSAPVSRLGTPILLPSITSSYSSSSSASQDGDVDHMELDGVYSHMPRHHHHIHHHHHHPHLQSSQSDGGSEEEDQEAVTPPPPPAAARTAGRRRMDVNFLTGSSDDLHSHLRESSKPAAVAPPRMEDAMLLLGFSQHVAH